MKICFTGAGVWARGLSSVSDVALCMEDNPPDVPEALLPPRPQAIPAKERRRAGLLINLAVEVAHQACEHAGINKSAVPSVFASAMGDTDITDYMCRKLCQPEKLLSPTKFHNSVHNAPSGYWTISTENRAPSTYVGGFLQSFGAGLFEAASQATATQAPVLYVAYDIANSAPFADVAPISESMGIALVVEPACANGRGHKLAADLQFVATDTPAVSDLPACDLLRDLALANPMGAGLTVVEQMILRERGILTAKGLAIAAAPQGMLSLTFAGTGDSH